MSDELKLACCPFCGGEANSFLQEEVWDDDMPLYGVCCQDKKCFGSMISAWCFETREEAISTWNRRATPKHNTDDFSAELCEAKDKYRALLRDDEEATCDFKRFTRRINKLPDCNDCGRKKSCEYAPRLGKQVRINCPLWGESK